MQKENAELATEIDKSQKELATAREQLSKAIVEMTKATKDSKQAKSENAELLQSVTESKDTLDKLRLSHDSLLSKLT